DAPLVLREGEVIVVAEIGDQLAAGQRSVDLRHGRLIVDQLLQTGVLQTASGRRNKKLELLLAAEVDAGLHGVVAAQRGKRILQLVLVEGRELRQVHGQPDGRAGRSDVESNQSQIGDLNGRNALRHRGTLRVRAGKVPAVGGTELVVGGRRQRGCQIHGGGAVLGGNDVA